MKELEAVKSIRKDGGNEEDWTVEGFGNCTKSPAAELKPSVRFNDENSSPSEGRLSEKIKSTSESSPWEENRSDRSNTEQSSRLQSEKERAR